MAWNDEIAEAAYTSPSGKRKVFSFEAVSRETDLKTATFTFPEKDGAEIQSLGLGGRRFPLKCIFSGADCCKNADEFEELIKERGYGTLEHPIYKKVDVVPTGTIKRTDDLISALNESVVEVTFAETITVQSFPDSEIAATDKIETALEEYEGAAAEAFDKLIKTETVEDRIKLQTNIIATADSLQKNLDAIAQQSPKKKFDLIQSVKNFVKTIKSMVSTLDKITSYAKLIATTTIKLCRLPSRIAVSVLAKIEGYSTAITAIFNNFKSDPFGDNAICNQYAVTSVAWGGMIAALSSGISITAQEGKNKNSDAEDGTFHSRQDVIDTVYTIQEMFEAYKEYCDTQISKDAFVDNSDDYEKLLEVVSYSLQALVEYSFSLPTTRIIVLDRDRQLLELLCELYGEDGFNRMDEFINDNKLNANEIVCLPMNKEVRYYV